MTILRALLLLAVLVAASTPGAVVAQAPGPDVGHAPPDTLAPCGDGSVCTGGTYCADERCVTASGAVIDPQRADPAYVRRRWIHVGIMIAGGVALGVGWLLNVLNSSLAGYRVELGGTGRASGFDPGWDEFRYVGYLPVVGPWIQLAIYGGPRWNVYLPSFGTLQAVGLATLVIGIVLEENNAAQPLPLVVAPMLGDGLAGLVCGGSF